jgi:hypothetical protein
LFTALTLNSQIRLDENFNYPEWDTLGLHGWVSFSGGSTNALYVATPGLLYSGYPLSNIGLSAKVRGTGQDAYKQFDSVTSASVYCAMMVNVDTARVGDYFFAYFPNNSTTNYVARTYIKIDGNNIAFGLSKSTDAPVYTPSVYSRGVTYILIIKYTFLTGSTTDDQMRMFVFSGAIPATEPAPTVGPVTGPITDAPNISRVALRQGTAGNAPTLWVDGMRVFLSWSNIVGINNISSIAESFSLSQNYPNPFNPETNIRFAIPERGNVSLRVYDMLGKEVSNLVDGNYSMGTYEVNFDGNGLGSGTYLYRINFVSETGKEFTDTRKLTLLK